MKKIVGITASVITTLLLIFIIVAVLVDYSRFNEQKEPIFCFQRAIYDYIDGGVKENVCLGYKVYYYERDSIKKSTFVPIWSKMEDSNKNG